MRKVQQRSLHAALIAALMGVPFCSVADSAVGVDTWRANPLDTTAGAASRYSDSRGTTWLRSGVRRTPSGYLYMCPAEPADMTGTGAWRYAGQVQAGVLAVGGDSHNALWNRYVDWRGGLILGLIELNLERSDDGSYARLRGSRISSEDEYYQAAFGRAGSYKIQAFLRDVPNILSNNAKPIWNGVGSNRLTLASGLSPGASSVADVAAVSAATAQRRLHVDRSKQGLGLDLQVTPQWSLYAALSDEQRKGARPFGGPFFFNFAFPDNSGVLETTKPVDDSTVNLNAGVRYSGPTWRMNLAYSGSFYRDRYTRFDYESPYALYPLIPGATSAPVYQGQFAMEPDNDYHHLSASMTRRIALNGEVSVTAAAGQMRQNDELIAPIQCQGYFGIDLNGSGQTGPTNPFLYSCANWNSPAALSRQRADLRIDTSLIDAHIVLQPTDRVSLRGGLKFNREDYRNTYIAFNPLTGQYGYVTENGSQGSIVPGEVGFWDAVTAPSAITRVRSLPLDMQTIDADMSGDWRWSDRNSLGATVRYSRYEPTNRERREVDTSSIKLNWTQRSLEWLTLRSSVTFLHQDGDRYNYDPYEFTYSISLPGFVTPEGGIPAHTVDALRKYDVAGRDERKADLIASVQPRDDMSLSATLRGDWNDYDAELGRQAYSTTGINLQWQWQPTPLSNANLYYGYDRSTLRLANVNDQDAGSDPSLGGAAYPLEGRWWADDHQRNHYAGAAADRQFRRWRLDWNWRYVYSRGETSYRFASPSALAYFSDGIGNEGGEFPPLAYWVNPITLGATIAINPRFSLRLFDTHERGRIMDWHYQGLDATRVLDHRVYTDGGPESYRANLFGVLLTVRL